MTKYVVAALYEFADLPDYVSLQAPLLDLCIKCDVKGTLLLASEGINGTIAGTRDDIGEVLSYIRSDERLKELVHKESYTDTIPFYRMKVRLKKEIVSMGVNDIKPKELVGTYVEPEDWNSLISDPDVLVIDTRNTYEYNIGTFKEAIDPQTETFRKFPEYVANNLNPSKYKKVAMFCTGGIRCEKATSFMLKQGFEEVYHLKGGILKYLEDIPEEDSLWEGECYVFDNRVSVNHKLEKGLYEQCHGCRYPITEEDIKSPMYQKGVSCPNCYDSITPDEKERYAERQHQVELAKLRNTIHIGSNHPQSSSD